MVGFVNKRKELAIELKKKSCQEKAKVLLRFFKTGPGEYGEGDVFWGIQVGDCRTVAKSYRYLSLAEVKIVLHSLFKLRLTALLILIEQFSVSPAKIYRFYLGSLKYINNWDLVDISSPKIVGAYLWNKRFFNTLQTCKVATCGQEGSPLFLHLLLLGMVSFSQPLI